MLKLGALFVEEAARYLWRQDYETCVRRVCTKAVKLNIVYAKVVQSLVVKFGPYVDVANNILPPRNYNPPVEPDGFLFDPEVLGSGMVSVVYSGEFKGKKAVLKVKRDGIELEIRAGLASIKRIFWWVNLVPFFRKFDLNMLYTEVEAFLTEQLDFHTEVSNQEKFRKMFEFNPLVVVPEVFHHTHDYIIMERLFPCALDETVKEHYAKLLSQIAIKSAIFDGFVHADVHIGNVVFLPERKLGIIDFGLVTHLNKAQQDDYFALFSAINQKNYVQTADITLEKYMHPRDGVRSDRTSAIAAMQCLYEKHDQNNKSFGMREISELMLAVYPFGYSVNPYFYKIAMSMAASDMFMQSLCSSSKRLFQEEIKAACTFS